MKLKKPSSEVQCASRMRTIEGGHRPLVEETYCVDEVAQRYGVHRDTVYKGIKSGDPMYPRSHPLSSGSKPRIAITRQEVEACDARRLVFYKTTPSWIRDNGEIDYTFPQRKSAKFLLA